MSSSTVRWIRRGIVGVFALAVVALAVGSIGTKPKQQMTFGATGTSVEGRAPTAQGGTAASAAVPAPAGVAGVTSTGGGVSADEKSAAIGLPDLGARIARTADITVEVKRGRFDQGWLGAFRIASLYDGQVMSSTRGTPNPVPLPVESQASSKTPASGDITIRFPASRFTAATNALRQLGVVRSDNISTQDVTQEFVDLNSRLRNLRAERDVFLGLFRRARTIGDTISIQTRLSDVEGQIEQITGRINYLDATTSFSTVTLHLGEPGAVAAATVNEGPSLSAAWETAKTGLVRIAGAALILGLWLAPFALVGLGGAVVWRRARRPAPQA